MSQALCFNDFTFSPVTRENQPWFRSSELARALGYSDDRKVSRLYDRNSDEFTPEMTQLIEIVDVPEMGTTGNLLTKVRIFSLRGCHLLAMFARTPVAKAFRRWVLDVIEQYGDCRSSHNAQRHPSFPPFRSRTQGAYSHHQYVGGHSPDSLRLGPRSGERAFRRRLRGRAHYRAGQGSHSMGAEQDRRIEPEAA